MARIVCQVLHRKDRITFIWSDGVTSFPPYHIEGDERTSLLRIADQIHPRIANAGPAELAQLGYQLYKSLFRVDSGPNAGSAIEARAWLTSLIKSDAIEAIEFLTDLPGRIAWNVLVEEIPATTDTAQRFWGTRFSLAAGRRVNPLRQTPVQSFPTQKWLVDPESTKRVGEDSRASLAELEKANLVFESAPDALGNFARNAPDVLVVFARFVDGAFQIGNETLTTNQLSESLEEAPHGNPDPLVVLIGLGDLSQQVAWQALLAEASTQFNGLVANETLLTASKAFEAAQALVKRFVEGGRSLGEILRSVRTEFGGAGLALTAFCPPQLRVVGEGSATFTPSLIIEPLPLPKEPYRPFAAYDLADRALFFGRESDAIRGALHCDRSDTVGVFVHGAPAVGKTSYLQAGLLPALEMDSVGYRVLRDRTPTGNATLEIALPWLVLRSTSDLAGQFADALACFCAQPLSYSTPAGQTVTVDLPGILRSAVLGHRPGSSTAIQPTPDANSVTTNSADALGDDATADELNMSDLWIALRDNADLLGQALDAITRVLPFELVIAVDQGEDLLTQVRKPHQEARRQKAIAMLEQLGQAAPRCKIIYTIRTQSLGRLLDLFANGHAPTDWRSFYLRALTDAEMGDALLYPTSRDDIPFANVVPFQQYHFSFDPGATQQIASDVATYARENFLSPLPILQAVGSLLYENEVVAKKQSLLRVVDMKGFGGVREALNKCFDAKVKTLKLSSAETVAMRDLLLSLCTSNADGTLDRDLVPANDLGHHWKAQGRPVADIVNRAADELGLFEIQHYWIQGKQELIVSLAQDSLAQLGRKAAEEKSANALARTKVMDLVIWIMVPLCFLSASVTYYFTRHSSDDSDTKTKLEKIIKDGKDTQKNLEQQVISARRPLYLGLLAQAEQAIQTDNALRARQLLLSQPATRSYAESKSEGLRDLRGFEWKHLWKRINGEQLLFAGHLGPVAGVAITPDGKRAATTSNDGMTYVWNLETRLKLADIKGSKSPMHAVALSPDGKTLAVAGADKRIAVYDLAALKTDFVSIDEASKTLVGHTDAINGLAFGKNADTLASASSDGTVILWDASAGTKKQTLQDHGTPVLALAFDTDAKTLASVDAKGQIIVWDGQSGAKRNAIATGLQTTYSLAITADGKTIATAGVEAKLGRDVGIVRFWNATDGKETQAPIQHGTGVLSVAISGDGKSAVTGGKDHILRVWDVATGKEKHHYLGHLGGVLALALAKDGNTLVSGSIDQSAKLWNIEHSAGVDIITAHADGVEALALDRTRMLIASAGKDGSVKLWDAKTGRALATLPGVGATVTSLAFSAHKEKHLLAAGTRDDKGKGAIKIWQLDHNEKLGWQATEKHTLTGHSKAVTTIAFHPSADKASLFLSGSEDATVILWDAETGKEKETYRGHKDAVRAVEFTGDARTFISAGKDGLVCLCETDKKEIRTISDIHAGGIDALSLANFATRGDHPESAVALFSAGADHSMRVVLIQHLERIANIKMEPEVGYFFRSHAQPVRTVACSLNPKVGVLLASGSDDGAVKILDFAGEVFTLVGHRGPVRNVLIAPDQSFVASSGSDGTIRIWRTANVRIDK